MPNWKKVITSGSDATLNQITSSGGIDSPDITIDDWGSVSASLASLDASVYGDSDVTDHINSLNVHSGSHLGTADTDDLDEGSANLYYTDGRVKTKLNAEGVLSGSSQVSFNGITDKPTLISGSNQLTGSLVDLTSNQTISGDKTFANIVVNGTASIQYLQSVTGSAKIIGDAYIILNAESPTERYAGIKVYDSGSGDTGSLEYDSLNNHWFYESTTEGYASGLIAGPRDSRGNITFPPNNRIPKGIGGNHISASSISDNGSTITLGNDTVIVGNLSATTISNVLSGSAQIAAEISGAFTSTSASIAADIATLDGLTYGDSDVTDHINSLDVHSGSHLGTADTDDLSEGSTNLYYTDTRVKTKLDAEGVFSGSSQVDINSTTGNLTTLGTVTSGDVSAILPSGVISGSAQLGIDDTDDVDEGSTNLYYTDARVKTKLNAEGVLSGSNTISGKTLGSNLDNLTVDNTTLQLNSGTTYNGSAARTISAKTGTVANGNTTLVTGDGVYDYVNPISSSIATDINSLETDISGLDNYGEWHLAGDADSTDVTSGKYVKFTGGASITGTGTELNPYVMTITPASSDTASYIDASSPSQGTITIGGNDIDLGLQVGDSPTFTDLTLTGNLTVEGTRTELQVTELNVEDKNITVASGAADSAAADGAGLTIAGANESLTWNHANSRFEFSDDLRVNNSLNIGSVSNAGTDTDKFLVLDSNGNVDFRTGTEVLSDIGGSGASNLSGAATEIPFFSSTSAITSSVRLKLNKNITTGDVLVHHGQFNVINDPSVSGTAAMQIIVGSGSSGDVSNPQYDSFLSMEQESATQVGLRANGTAPTSAQIKMRTDVNDAYSIGRLTNPYGANTLRIKPAIIAEGGLSITGSLTISGSNTLKNIGPAEFSGSVKIKTSNQVQASTDTDKFVVLDGQELKYRSGTQVYDDIGVTSLSSSIAADIAALDTSAGGGTIYTSNGNLTGDRAISGVGGSHSLSFNSLEFFAINNASAISLEGSAIYLSSLPTATGSALNNSLYLDSITGEVKYASAATLSSITANGASTTNTIRAGGLLVTGSVTISGSNTLINQGPAEFSGSVSINTTDQVQASTDTDKFLVLDGDQIKYRSGAQVRSDIGATAAQNLQSVTDTGNSTTNVIQMPNFTLSSPTNNGTSSDKILVLDGSNRSKFRTRDELRSDIGALQASRTPQIVVTAAEVLDEALTGVYIPFSGINIFPDSNTTAYSRFHAPYDGYIKEIIVHPHEAAASGTCTITPAIDGTGTTPVQATISATAGTPTTFTFGSSGYGFSDGDDIVLEFDREANDRSKGFSFTIVFIMDATS